MGNGTHRVAIVTGAGKGIGRLVAARLGMEGFDVALHYWDGQNEASSTAEAIRQQGHRAVTLHGDLTEPGVPQKIVDDAIAQLGQVDLVVNNAGVTFTREFMELTPEDVDACYRINYLAPLWIAQTAARWMLAHSHPGNIIQITSVHQERTTDRDNIYGSMKAALARLTESMAYELAPHHIRVNAIAPGRISTPEQQARRHPDRERQIATAIPVGWIGDAEDVAAAVLWLASDESRYVTGVTLRVDGGLNLAMPQASIDGVLRFI